MPLVGNLANDAVGPPDQASAEPLALSLAAAAIALFEHLGRVLPTRASRALGSGLFASKRRAATQHGIRATPAVVPAHRAPRARTSARARSSPGTPINLQVADREAA